MSFTTLPTDPYASPGYDSGLAKIDNYQIYSLIIDDGHYQTSLTTYQNGEFQASVPGYLSRYQISNSYPYDYEIDPYAPPYIFDNVQSGSYTDQATPYNQSEGGNAIPFYPGDALRQAPKCVTYQSFSPLGKINFNFGEIAKAYPSKNSKIRIWWSSVGRIEGWVADPHPSYQNLWTGFMTDQRVRPSMIKCIATSTRRVKWGYYRRNSNEDHPNVIASLDWHQGTIEVTKGNGYALPLVDPVLGTLLIDGITQGELLASPVPPGNYPYIYLFANALPGLMAYWESLRTRLEPPANPNISHVYANTFYVGRINHPGGDQPANGRGYYLRDADRNVAMQSVRFYPQPTSDPSEAITLPINVIAMVSTVAPGAPVTRIIAANNNRWKHGTVTVSDNPPAADHQVFSVNEHQLFEALQTDGSYGSLTMDSPRILEIHAALEAGKYAVNELDPNVPRVPTLGHLIARSAAILGYRPQPDGTIDQAAEKTTYQRGLVRPDAKIPVGDYMAGRFGKRGLLMRRLPNKKTNKGWEAGGYVAIHDIPQLLTEVLDQLNEAMNLQDSTSIQIKDGGNTYTYASQLALLVEMATTLIPQKRQLKEIWTSSLVSQQSINEVIAGIGLPTVAKSVTIGGAKLPYWGIQPDKSLQREIATVAYNVGLGNGQIL